MKGQFVYCPEVLSGTKTPKMVSVLNSVIWLVVQLLTHSKVMSYVFWVEKSRDPLVVRGTLGFPGRPWNSVARLVGAARKSMIIRMSKAQS